MARLFVKSSSQYLSPSTLPSLGSTISISYWYYDTTAPGGFPNRFIIILRGDQANTINYDIHHDGTGGANAINFEYTTANNVFVKFSGAVTFDTGTWHHVLAVSDFTTAGSKTYLDGTALSMSTNGTPGTPTTSFTEADTIAGLPQTSEFLNGRLADIAIWNVILTAAEASALAKGARPFQIRPPSLVRYYPISGLQSPEPDLSGSAANATLTNGPVNASGPPVMQFTPRWPQRAAEAAAAAPTILLPGQFSTSFAQRVSAVGY